MAADGFAIGVGNFLSSSATAYFRKFGKLAPKDLAVSGVAELTGAATFEALITAIKNSRQTEFLVYAHGQSDGSGLFVRMATRRGTAIGTSASGNMVNVLNAMVEAGKATERQLTTLVIAAEEGNRLIALGKALREKKIQTIEFRGCNLGKNSTTMQAFKKFFGAKSFGAPDLYSFFGTTTVNIGSQFANHRSQRAEGTWYEFPYDFKNPAGTLINNIMVEEMKPVRGYVVADSLATVQRWVKERIDSKVSYESREGNLTLHGMWDTGKRKIDPKEFENMPLGQELPIPPPTLLMPLDPDFSKHVIYI